MLDEIAPLFYIYRADGRCCEISWSIIEDEPVQVSKELFEYIKKRSNLRL
jgi:hypothetical protein